MTTFIHSLFTKQFGTKLGALFCATALLSGCTGIYAKSASIVPGTSRAEVMKVMGPPHDRSFNGKGGEAWQYCQTGAFADKFLTVWLAGNQVTGLTTYTGSDSLWCRANFRSVDWGQAPYDQRIKIDKNINITND